MVTNRARQEIIWIVPAEKFPTFAQTIGTVDVFDPHSDIHSHFAESFRMSKSS